MNERAIFFEAIERPEPGERSAFLDTVCADDPALRGRIEALLRVHERSGDFLARTAPEQLGGVPTDLRDSVPDLPRDLLAPSDRANALGRLGHYDILGVVGRGGMGIVLRAFDAKLRRIVAIKVLAPALAVLPSARERFVREAQVAAAVHHENVVSIHAVEDQGPIPYLVMTFVDGPTLQEKVRRHGPLPASEVVRIGIEAAEGLAAAHREGLVHRDVKPANILLENGVERVKITDFGLARAVDDATVTQSGMIAGTPSYMSPEQADGRRVDPRSDLFSLGSVLYFACTGETPFGTDSTPSVLRRVCDQRPAPIRSRNPAVPAWLERLIDRLHAKDPGTRPQSAAAVVDLLRAGDTGQLDHGREPGRLRLVGALALLSAVLLVGLLGAAEATGVIRLRGAIASGLLARPSKTGSQAFEEAGVPPEADAAWEARVAGLPPAEQLQAVSRRLQELNPGFDGTLHPVMRDGHIAGLGLLTDHVTDILPLRALRALRSLDLSGTYPMRGKLTDLSPLRGLPLESLDIHSTRVSDLGPIAGMRLWALHCGETRVHDLSPVKGMPLRALSAQRTDLHDLEPLRGMALTSLDIYGTLTIQDLGPISDMPIDYLNIGATYVSDLSPVRTLPRLERLVLDDSNVVDLRPLAGLRNIARLQLIGTNVTDLTPLRSMRVRELKVTYRPEWDAFLKALPGLETVNDRPLAEFSGHPAVR